MSPLPILTVGPLPEDARKTIESIFGPRSIVAMECDMEKIMAPAEGPVPKIVAVGPPPEGISLDELAQVLRMQYAGAPIFFTTSVRAGFDKLRLRKNGFTDCFLLPFDSAVFATALRDALSEATQGKLKSYRAVKLVDVTPGTALSFDVSVYMPANRKYLKIVQSGDELDPQLAERLNKSQVSSLFVEKGQMKNFYEFTAKQLSELGKPGKISVTERIEKMKGAVRDLLGGLFNDAIDASTVSRGREIGDDCRGIVNAFIGEGSEGPSWHERMLSAVNGESGSYNRAADVSVYATLFALGLGMETAKEVGVAGLLHDIGMADLPPELQDKDEEELTQAEQIIYYRHPQHSLEIIKNRKIIVSPLVMNVIEQHHECFSGQGFPSKLPGHRVLKETQVLGLAIQFERLTSLREGKKRYTPVEAMAQIEAESRDPSRMRYEPELVRRLAAIFAGPRSAQSS